MTRDECINGQVHWERSLCFSGGHFLLFFFFQLAIFILRIQLQAREAVGLRLQAFAHLISLLSPSVCQVMLRDELTNVQESWILVVSSNANRLVADNLEETVNVADKRFHLGIV